MVDQTLRMHRTIPARTACVAVLAAAGLAGCVGSTPVASRAHEAEPAPASGGEEQHEVASAQAHRIEARGAPAREAIDGPDNGGAWMHAAAAQAVASHAVGLGGMNAPGVGDSDALMPHIPAENPDAAMVDGMEGLAQLTFAQDGSDFDPCVSRDGKWLVFASTQHRPTPDIYVKPVGSRTVTQLTADPASEVMPDLSPDGTKIAFCSNRSGWWNLYVMSVGGGQAVHLSAAPTHDLHPSWSPDGTRLVFCRLGQTSGRWELWVMEVSRPQVAEFIGYGMFPRWCPVAGTGSEGRDRILFQRGRERGDRAFSLWTIEYGPGSAGNPTEIVAARAAAAISASWSPDGRWVAYSTVPTGVAKGSARGAADLWITAVDGSGRVNLTGGKFSNLMPAWGGDGRIYFVSDRNGLDQVWSIGTSKALAAAGGGGGGGAHGSPMQASHAGEGEGHRAGE